MAFQNVKVATGIALVLLIPWRASAQVFESVGVRALGMGGAFVAVADDASAVYWNPAGFATGSVFTVVIERQGFEAVVREPAADARGLDASSGLIGLGAWPLGLAYYRVRLTQVRPEAGGTHVVQSLIAHQTSVVVLHTVAQGLTVGGALKLVRGVAASQSLAGEVSELADQGADLVGRARNALDMDLGVMANFGRARIGLVARNLREPTFRTPGGGRLGLDRQVRIGAAFQTPDHLTIAADLDLTTSVTVFGERRHVAAGAEQWWGNRRIGLRGGIRANTLETGRVAGSAGFSIAARRGMFVDAQITRGGDDADRGWGVGLRLSF